MPPKYVFVVNGFFSPSSLSHSIHHAHTHRLNGLLYFCWFYMPSNHIIRIEFSTIFISFRFFVCFVSVYVKCHGSRWMHRPCRHQIISTRSGDKQYNKRSCNSNTAKQIPAMMRIHRHEAANVRKSIRSNVGRCIAPFSMWAELKCVERTSIYSAIG